MAEHLFDLLVQVTNTHQIAVSKVVIELGQRIEYADVLPQLAPELESVAISLDSSAYSMARFRELILTVVALSLEEWVDALALLTSLALFAGEVAVLDYLRHALLPAIRC